MANVALKRLADSTTNKGYSGESAQSPLFGGGLWETRLLCAPIDLMRLAI